MSLDLSNGISKVFLSSTVRDLDVYRAAVLEIISKTGQYLSISMENFGVRDAPPVEYCIQKVRECDIYVGIFSHYRGFELKNDRKKRSITQIEYDEAIFLNKPRLLFVAPDDFMTKFNLLGSAEVQNRQKKFLNLALRDRVVSQDFKSPDRLAASVLIGLLNTQTFRLSA